MNLLTHIRRLLLFLATIFSLGTVDDLWAAEQRPNIVFILSDDQNKNYPMPNLFVSVLQRLGLETDRFATSTGSLSGLEMT